MRRCNQGRFSQQVRFLRRQFLQDGELPFANVLSKQIVSQALTAAEVVWNDCVYQPLVTLWVFLSQVISEDHSCRAAVARLITHRLSHGEAACSEETSAYCQARKRLPEKFFADVALQTGQALDNQPQQDWLWKQRRVYLFDGSTVSMPDTAENQHAYPQPDTQKPGLGFPLAKIAAFFSLSCGAIINLGICRYAGKGNSELGLLHKLWDVLRPGDVMLADRYMSAWHEIYRLQQRGIDIVTRLHYYRKADFRRGQRLGRGDHIVAWPKPKIIRSISWPTYLTLPDRITIRETRVEVQQPGFRSQSMVVVSTLLDAEAVTSNDLAELYRARWNVELDFRSLKRTLQMEVLRCKTPELVRKELWTHILAYNLIRTIMAQAAAEHDLQPRTISFKGAIQFLEEFQRLLDYQPCREEAQRRTLYQQLLNCIASQRVGDRSNRWEPRLRKRRPKHYAYLRKPRNVIKNEMAKGVTKV